MVIVGKNPVRFYTVQLSLSDKGIDRVTFTGTHPLLADNNFSPAQVTEFLLLEM